MIIAAPYPSIKTITLLPDPVLSNQELIQDQHDYKFAMDKTVRSYVRRTPKHIYVYSFLLTRMKAAELKNFVVAYSGDFWSITDHQGANLVVQLVNSPFEFDYFGHHTGACPDQSGYSLNERSTVTLEFEA